MKRLDKKELQSIDVHALPDMMVVSLWVIEYLSTELNESFGSSEIARYIVENIGISTTRQAIHLALTRATSRKFCHKLNKGFSLMKSGQEELQKQMLKEKVILIQPGKPFEAGMKIENIFSGVKGTLKISDPFVDVKSLNVIYRSANVGVPIRILTVQIKDESSFKREIQNLQHEGLDIEVRKTPSGILHDRYFIDDEHFWLSGNSLNNLGKKESFIVTLGKDLRDTVNQTFNSRWQSGISL